LSCYYFRIPQGTYSGASDAAVNCTDDNAAWKEMTIVCGDLAGDIARGLKPGTNWQMELLDAERKVVFRIHIAAEATV
jgi:hypothetical protein